MCHCPVISSNAGIRIKQLSEDSGRTQPVSVDVDVDVNCFPSAWQSLACVLSPQSSVGSIEKERERERERAQQRERERTREWETTE